MSLPEMVDLQAHNASLWCVNVRSTSSTQRDMMDGTWTPSRRQTSSKGMLKMLAEAEPLKSSGTATEMKTFFNGLFHGRTN